MGLFSRRKIGSHYESMASQYLTRHGLTLIEENFSAKCGEIDLIMRDQSSIVFVEVKYRKQAQYGHAAEMVTTQKMRKLVNTANVWLQKQGLSAHSTEYRFDVMAIEQNGKHINWIKNAITQG
ncbi:YraN family protein [Vibrio sp. T187]|uniref:YraN family protein n=1 Tax=Vibrio TaxID=662 RepID=UPI0010C9F46B|nr:MULTISPECIES: YraN family protein [Vibrio]MBW3697138.1 YraN family protein [Vibrio sp. T187]